MAYRSSEQVARFQSWDAPYPREEGERFIREIAKEHPDTAGEWFQFAVVLRSTRQLIGDCAAMPHADDPRQREIGFTIAAEHQGHGYATEAVRMLLTYLFTARGKHRITAYCPGHRGFTGDLGPGRSRPRWAGSGSTIRPGRSASSSWW